MKKLTIRICLKYIYLANPRSKTLLLGIIVKLPGVAVYFKIYDKSDSLYPVVSSLEKIDIIILSSLYSYEEITLIIMKIKML